MRLVGQACFVLLLKIRLLNSRTNTQSHVPTVEQRGGVDGPPSPLRFLNLPSVEGL